MVSSPLGCQNRCRQHLQLPFLLEEGYACLPERVILMGIASAHADGVLNCAMEDAAVLSSISRDSGLQGISHLLNKEL